MCRLPTILVGCYSNLWWLISRLTILLGSYIWIARFEPIEMNYLLPSPSSTILDMVHCVRYAFDYCEGSNPWTVQFFSPPSGYYSRAAKS